MSEAHTISERAGKLNLDGDRRMARRRLCAWERKLLAAAPELAPALRPLPAVEADGPATATTGARAARDAARASRPRDERVGAKASPPKTSASASTIFIMVKEGGLR